MSDHFEWMETVNAELVDHDVRLAIIERKINLDDTEYTWPPGELANQYDLRTAPERHAMRIDNHDQRLRAIEHRLLLIEIELREMRNATPPADGV